MNNVYIKYVKYILLYLSFAIMIMPIRLVGVFNTAYIILPITLLISTFISFHFFIVKKGRGLNFLEISILIMPFFSIPLALANEHEIKYIITDSLKPMLWIGIIGYFKNVFIDENFFIEKISNSISLLTFCSVLTVSFVSFIFMTVGGIRASASDIAMLFPLLYFFVRGKYLLVTMMFLILIAGGKVGPLFSVLVITIIYFILKLSFKTMMVTVISFTLMVVLVMNFNFEEWKRFLPILSKFNIFFDESLALNNLDVLDKYFFGGRLAEVVGSLKIYQENPFLWFSGPGVGYTYELYRDGILENANHHGVHFSPVAIYTIYGGGFLAAFYGYLVYVLFKSFKAIRSNTSKLKTLAAMFFIANLINSFTVFSIFSVLLFPLCIGLILNKSLIKKTGEI